MERGGRQATGARARGARREMNTLGVSAATDSRGNRPSCSRCGTSTSRACPARIRTAARIPCTAPVPSWSRCLSGSRGARRRAARRRRFEASAAGSRGSPGFAMLDASAPPCARASLRQILPRQPAKPSVAPQPQSAPKRGPESCLGGQGVVPCRVALLLDHGSPEVFLSGQGVVGRAA